MTQSFGSLPGGEAARLYTICGGGITAGISDFGATLVRLLVPDRNGRAGDVALGFDTAGDYLKYGGCLGATVGRNANRVGGSCLNVGEKTVRLTPNEGPNNLHSGPDYWYHRMWMVDRLTESAITLALETPDGDQGFPGAGRVEVTYALTGGALRITYRGIFDQDTLLNMTNHTYFNLAGEDRPEAAMEQTLQIQAERFTQVDEASIPTGRLLPVAGTALDFRRPKALKQDQEDSLLAPQGGIDHNFVLDPGEGPAARLVSRETGRILSVYTDCPGIQVYTANFLEARGKGGRVYGRRSGVCLETQFYPDSSNHPQWPSPLVRAGEEKTSVTELVFGLC
ncbi:MAG: aldose epimerase family protein [Oscillospiraceae bacterium]